MYKLTVFYADGSFHEIEEIPEHIYDREYKHKIEKFSEYKNIVLPMKEGNFLRVFNCENIDFIDIDFVEHGVQ